MKAAKILLLAFNSFLSFTLGLIIGLQGSCFLKLCPSYLSLKLRKINKVIVPTLHSQHFQILHNSYEIILN